jgi:transposase
VADIATYLLQTGQRACEKINLDRYGRIVGMNQQGILPGMESQVSGIETAPQTRPPVDSLRFRRPDRSQMRMVPLSLDETIPAEHHVRVLWDVVERLDLSEFSAGLKVCKGEAGRSATDVRLLTVLWLYAATEGVGSARELARLCEYHAAYQWLCGGVRVNYHTLSDFRVDHEKALDTLMTEVLAMLMDRKLVSVHRISQDGMRVRASAGQSSFRREQRLQSLLEQAKTQVAVLKTQREAPARGDRNARQVAAQERAVRERLDRVNQAIAALEEVKKVKARSRDNHRDKRRSPRASTSDHEARVMKMPDGGFRPAYNVQLATDTDSRAIVEVDVTNEGTDKAQSEPMRQEVQSRTGDRVKEHLMDGGFVKLEQIERAEQAGVKVYAPPQQSRKDIDPYRVRDTDSSEIAAWRTRMASEQGKAIYKERASTSETVNADLRTYRGVSRFLVRGLRKVRCVVLWSALAYNLMHFGKTLLMD